MGDPVKKLFSSFSNKTAILFSSSSVILSIVKLISGIMVIKWVTPEDVGLWNSVSLVQAYAAILQLGILSGLNRELPFYIGKGNNAHIIKLAETANYFIRWCNYILLGVSILASLYVYFFISSDIKLLFGIIAIGIIVITGFYNTYLSVTYRASSEFLKLSKIQLYISAFTLVTVILPYYYTYYGLVIRTVLISIFSVVAIYMVRPLRVKAAFDKASFKELIKTGLPIYGLGYLEDIAKTFNRTILLAYGGVLIVGYYSPATAIITGMAMLPAAIGQYIYPQMSYSLGKFNDSKKLWKWVWKSAFAMLAIGVPAILIGWFTIPYFVSVYFPNYSEGIFAAQMALIAGVFDSAVIGINVLNTLKAFKWLTILTIFKLALFWFVMQYFASVMNPIDGVSVGLVVAQVVFFLVTMVVCYKVTYGFDFKKAQPP
ncbi:MAG: oligosaccharide flippase family protein, partial [Ignavibacteria bacterium]|nr:oligosaccharide flippase family protein [Ignavibacteria bacterium]